MAFFYSFTESLKQKWLQFFQVNRDWITIHMEVESVYTPDGGKRPPSYLILGVVNALEPKLAQLMLPFSRLNPDADTLVEVLELNFDPDIVLGNRVIPKVEMGRNEESGNLMSEDSDEETLTNSHISGFAVAAIDLDTHEETLMVLDTTMDEATLEENQLKEVLNGISNNSSFIGINEYKELNQTHTATEEDELSDISFDLKDGNNISAAAIASSSGNGFADVVSDIWGDEAAANNEENVEADNDMFLGEDISSDDLDDEEIANLFPNH